MAVPVLLLVIFLLVLFFALAPKFLPGLSRKLVDLAVVESSDEVRVREEMRELRKALQETNMVDDFAKYAKTERKITKLKDNLNSICKSKTEVFLKLKLGFNVAFHACQLACFLFIIYNYRHTPLVEMESDWLFPINKVISFPTGLEGTVSVTFWIVVCKSAVPRILTACGR